MLTTLRIKNLALVDDLTLEPGPGYNVITGETGAGKSIIIGALKLLLGERADRTLLRAGCDACTVEAVFDVSRLDPAFECFLNDNGLEPCEAQQLVLKRTLAASGSNRQFVNGSPTPLATLAAIGEWLVDIHGPHDHQSLLRPSRQLEILDAHAGLAAEREAFAGLVRQHTDALARKAELIVDEATHAQQLDLLGFQVRAEYKRAGNGARLLELAHATLEQLLESETSLLSQAGHLTRSLQELSRLDPSTAPLVQQHEQAIDLLRETAGEISAYVDRIEIDPARLQALEERLNLFQSLKRKYGSTLAAVIEFGERAQTRLRVLEQREELIEQLNAELGALRTRVRQAGRQLSDKRRRIMPKLCKEVERQLHDLGFKSSQFDVLMDSQTPAAGDEPADLKSSGFDSVDFQFAPNPGEPVKPLRAIASSGELARVMLALKTVLAVEDSIPVLVFDEVDANVGGETAHTVGEKMRQISVRRQVFCITHLPQVAAPATGHYVVTKTVKDGRTLSRIASVSGDDRIRELARMLGGKSAAALQHAEAILAGTAA